MKFLVETKGSFSLYDPTNGQVIRKNGYTVVENTGFVERQRAYQITLISELNDNATDEDWLQYVKESDGDLELAKDAYLSSFGLNAVAEPEGEGEAPKKRGRKPKVDE